MQVEMWSVGKFVPYSRELRKNDNAVERMMASIKEFGFKIPILARSSGEVVDGHLRLKAALKLELQELPVILCDDWNGEKVKAFRLMVNRSASWAESSGPCVFRILIIARRVLRSPCCRAWDMLLF